MKKAFFFILVLLAAAIYWKYPSLKQKVVKKRLSSQLNTLKTTGAPLEDLPFVIVVPSFNNEKFCEKNLESIFSQEYSNYRVIYIEDASTDRTREIVSQYIEKKMVRDKCKLIQNEKNLGALENIYNAVHMCRNDEIVLICDGDDWLASSHVLRHLNEAYNNRKVWMTYGQYIEYPAYQRGDKVGICKPVDLYTLKKGTLRHKDWVTSHLRTFYAGLFKKIKKSDLQFEGKFFPTTADLAMMFPMLEMARSHAYFVNEILYVYNYTNPLNDNVIRREKQQFYEKYIRSLPVYQKLESHPSYL